MFQLPDDCSVYQRVVSCSQVIQFLLPGDSFVAIGLWFASKHTSQIFSITFA
jgi:hypothetical protein